jgi:two-component sensor histidine kinase
MAEFETSYIGRVHALSTAYSLLSHEGWQTVGLKILLLEELQPFLSPSRSNIDLEGPNVLLEPRAALSLGMAIHELTTNAVKHGALSVPEGRVRITWHMEPLPDGEILVLNWSEADGPPVSPPARKGFGMTLIERGLKQVMAADVTVDFQPAGVTAMLRAPLTIRGPDKPVNTVAV